MNITKKRKWMLPTCLLLAAVFVIAPAAWFAGVWTSDPAKLPFTTGGNPSLYGASMWMYTSAYEVIQVEGATEGWKEFSVANGTVTKADGDTGYIIPQMVYSIDGDGKFTCAEANLVNLHFGRIDNLEDLNEDNRIYFRFELKKAEHGDEILAFYFDYKDYGTDVDPRNSIKIYNSEGALVTNTNGLQKDYAAQMQLLELTYCVSNNAYAPGTDDFNALVFKGNDKDNTPIPIMNNNSTSVTPSGATTVTLPTDLNDTYYLYVCMSPKLENFGLHENILEFFAQSYMLFNVNFSFEVH